VRFAFRRRVSGGGGRPQRSCRRGRCAAAGVWTGWDGARAGADAGESRAFGGGEGQEREGERKGRCVAPTRGFGRVLGDPGRVGNFFEPVSAPQGV